MALLTSYLFKYQELNDGNPYLVPSADLTLDDRTTADAAWAYRKDNTPVQTALSFKEGVFTLNIEIKAEHGETPAQYEAKLNKLKLIFNTEDPNFYTLERKFPHEASYLYLRVAPRQVTINRITRRVSVTFHTPDRKWTNGLLKTKQITLFETSSRQEYMFLDAPEYAGISATEPIITIKSLTAGSDGPVPLYWRNVTVYTCGGSQVVNSPVRVVAGWDTAALVSGSKMRADGLDITVTLPDGTALRRYVGGSQGSRTIWINPQTWDFAEAPMLTTGAGAGDGTHALLSSDMFGYFKFSNAADILAFPVSGKFMINNEVIAYDGLEISAQDGLTVKLTFTSRGADSTTPTSWGFFQRMKRPTVLRVNYGYMSPFLRSFQNDLSQWPVIDYETSTNTSWEQIVTNTSTFVQSGSASPARPLTWFASQDLAMPKPNWQSFLVKPSADPATGTAKMQMTTLNQTGNYSVARDRITMQIPTINGRILSNIQVRLKLDGGSSAYPTFIVRLMKVKKSFGQGRYEEVQEIWSTTHTGGLATVNTPTISTEQWNYPGSHFFIRVDAAAPGGPTVAVELDRVYFQPDQEYGRAVVVTSLGSEQGVTNGEYPVYLTIKNYNDGANPQSFSVFTRLAVNATATVNCLERTVENMELGECTFDNPIWLRIMPTSNAIEFTGPAGAGQLLVTLSWYERY